jgi:hypothetical protein
MNAKMMAVALTITLGLAAGAANATPTTTVSSNGHTVNFADGKMAPGSFSYSTTFTESFNGKMTGFSLNDASMKNIAYSLVDLTDSKTIASGTTAGSINLTELFNKGDQFKLTVDGTVGKQNGFYIGTVSAVPEPSESALIVSGLALIGFIAARRSKNDSSKI